MAVARSNPLAPGLYWLDVWHPTQSASKVRNGEPAWLAWVRANTGKVVVLKSEPRDEPLLGGGAGTFNVFRVTAPPSAFPFAALGFPETTTNPNLGAGDTVQKPPPEPTFDFSFLTDALQGVSGPVVIIGLIYLLTKD